MRERKRPRRGRPVRKPSPSRRGAAPTRTRLLALRVLERVQRAGAYADVLLHSTLARSGLSAPDRAFATELVYGTLRWRGRLDHLLGRCLDRDLEKLEPLVATALRLGAYQIVVEDRVPTSAAVDESVRCLRAAGVERATGLANAVLRRLAADLDKIPEPKLVDDPLGHLMHALSLPQWIARRWIEQYGPEEAAALARASNQPPPLTVRANRRRTSRESLLAEMRERFPEARACTYAVDGIVLGRRGWKPPSGVSPRTCRATTSCSPPSARAPSGRPASMRRPRPSPRRRGPTARPCPCPTGARRHRPARRARSDPRDRSCIPVTGSRRNGSCAGASRHRAGGHGPRPCSRACDRPGRSRESRK